MIDYLVVSDYKMLLMPGIFINWLALCAIFMNTVCLK